MKMSRAIQNSLFALALLASPIVAPIAAHAQNCALCYSQAAGSGSRAIAALKSGILVLIFPPMMICIGLGITSYKKRNRFHQKDDLTDKSDLGW